MEIPTKSQCRSCLAPETVVKKHLSIFEHDLQQAYCDLTQFQLLPDSPYNNICIMCSKLLQSFSEFRSQCLETNAYFTELEAKQLIKELQTTPSEEEIDEPVDVTDDIKEEVLEETEEIEDLNQEENFVEVEDASPSIKITSRSMHKKRRNQSFNPLDDEEENKSPTKKKRKHETRVVLKENSRPTDFFVCDHCPEKVFTNKQYYREHLKIHKEGKLECHFCGLKYRSKYFLLGHIDRNHLEKDYGKRGDFVCTECPKRYLTPVRLKKHLSIHKMKKKACPHCGELVKNLCSHMAVHNLTERYKCDKCDKSYKSLQHLQIHAIVHENKIFSCDICGKTFNRPDKVLSHKKIHETNRPVFECPDCKKHFNYKTALTGHMRTHTGERPYSCQLCGMSFALSGNLKKHMHSHNQTKPYMCKICTFGTKKKTELEYHLQKCHEIDEMNEEYQTLDKISSFFV